MVSELSEVGVQRCTIARSMWEHEFLRTQQGDAGVAMLRYAALLERGRDVSFVRGRKSDFRVAPESCEISSPAMLGNVPCVS